jgi:uncharacterized cupredoxin-like copper-binding protein
MKKMNKTIAAGIAALTALLMLGAGTAQAAGTADLTVTVTIQKLDITATFRDAAGTTFALGSVAAGSNNLISDPITVTNSGNLTETYNVKVTAEPNATWTSVTAAPDAEEYQMSGVFRAVAAAAPGTGDYTSAQDDYSVSTTRTADGADALAVNGDDGGAGTKGYHMAAGSNIYLWLKFKAPSTTVITTQQSIVTRITAATP